MATFQKPDGITNLILQDDIVAVGSLSAVNAEVILAVEGRSILSFLNTTVSVATLTISVSNDQVNWRDVPVTSEASLGIWLGNTVATQTTLFYAHVGGHSHCKIRVTAYTSGTVTLTARVSNTPFLQNFVRFEPTTSISTLTTANTAGNLVIPASGFAGLHTYVSSIVVTRINNSAAAVAGTAILTHTMTNQLGTFAVSSGNALAVGESKEDIGFFPANPLRTATANTAITLAMVAAGAGVQIRATANYWYGR